MGEERKEHFARRGLLAEECEEGGEELAEGGRGRGGDRGRREEGEQIVEDVIADISNEVGGGDGG